MADLKPCPFCGAKARYLPFKVGFYSEAAICDDCHINMPPETWNHRASPKESEGLELPPLPEPKYAADDLTDIFTADQMQQYAREAVASLKAASDAAIALAGETIAARNAEIAELREAVEADRRAQSNSSKNSSSCAQQPAPAATIGDDAKFLRLLGDWMAGLDYFQSDEHKEVVRAWEIFIAHIDAKLAEARREAGQQEGP